MFDTEDLALSDEGPVLGPGWLHFTSTILLILGVVFAVKFWREQPRVAPIVLGACAIPAAITIIQVIRLKRSLGTAELSVSDLIPLGWSGTAVYLRPLRGATVREIEARLQCDEIVVKGRGNKKKERRAVVLDQPLTPVTTPMMEQLRLQIPLRIPATGPPSIDVRDARTEWWVRLRLQMEGCPNTRSSFRIEVLPAVKR